MIRDGSICVRRRVDIAGTRSRQERYLTHAAGSDASLQSKQLQSPFGLLCLEA